MAEDTKEQISADDWGAAMAEQAAVDPRTTCGAAGTCSNNSAPPAARRHTTTWT